MADAEDSFAVTLRSMRKAAGLTQQQLADQTEAAGWHLHRQTIAKIETGARAIRLNDVAAVAAVLGVRITDLIDNNLTAAMNAGDRLRAADRELRERIAADILRGAS